MSEILQSQPLGDEKWGRFFEQDSDEIADKLKFYDDNAESYDEGTLLTTRY